VTGCPLLLAEGFLRITETTPTRKPRTFLIHCHASSLSGFSRCAYRCDLHPSKTTRGIFHVLSGPQKWGKLDCKVQPPNASLLRSGMR